MMRSVITGYADEMETYSEQFSESPFAELHPYEHGAAVAERYDETLSGNWEFSTPSFRVNPWSPAKTRAWLRR